MTRIISEQRVVYWSQPKNIGTICEFYRVMSQGHNEKELMKELMKGKPKNDAFWNRYQDYFGGGLD